MDLKNMRWHDYIILIVFFGFLAYYIVPFIYGLFTLKDDDSRGLMTIALIIAAPIAITAIYALVKIILKTVRTK